MNNKKGIFFIALFLIVFLSLIISAADACDIQVSCAPENTVLKLSSTTNAHAEIYSETNYNYYLCCNFTGIHTQDGNNKIFGLYSTTNAHAEIPSLSNYAVGVYFGNLECSSNSSSCPSGYDIPMLSLSSTTNAHLADFATYPIKVCCRQRCTPDCSGRECGPDPVCGTSCGPACPSGETCNINGRCVSEEIYWANANDPRYAISYLEVVPGVTQVALVLKGINPPEGTMDFEIYEDGPLDNKDIRTGGEALNADVDSLGTSIAYWTITQQDIDTAQRITDPFGSLDNFYFSANLKQSDDLAITISGGSCVSVNDCMSYNTESMCEQDTCLVATGSVGAINSDIDCGISYACGCFWNNATNNCSANWQSVNQSLGVEIDSSSLGIGVCNYNENTYDDCANGLLTYLWVADIDWPADNMGWINQSGCIDAGGDALSCVFFDSSIESGFDDLWHYDPLFSGINSLLTECFGGENTAVCPAQIQLSVFTLKNFIIVIIILIGVYIVYNQKKKPKKIKKKSKSRKK